MIGQMATFAPKQKEKEMKKFLFTLLIAVSSSFCLSAKDVRVSVTPSDASIYIDGNYVADGVVDAHITKDFIVVKIEREGYVTLETKIYRKDSRKGISYTLKRDTFLDVTNPSGLVNKYFTIAVSPDLYTVDEFGKQDAITAWKMMHQILLDYFDEIQTTDFTSGFIQTPWQYETYADAEKKIRTRISIRQINIGGDLTFQIKISSEVAHLLSPKADESFQPMDRVSKNVETIIAEMQSRIARK